jgi:hypothetical protein
MSIVIVAFVCAWLGYFYRGVADRWKRDNMEPGP